MKILKTLAVSTLFLLGSSAFSVASAGTIDFDDVAVPTTYTFLNDGYQGFNWSGSSGAHSWVISKSPDNWFSGDQAHSGQNFAWSNNAADLTMSGSAFNLDSLWGRNSNNHGKVTVHGFFRGAEIATQTLKFTDEYQQFNLNLKGIDQVTFSNKHGNILLDDISVSAISAVPEPETYAMLLAGLGMLGFMARRRPKG